MKTYPLVTNWVHPTVKTVGWDMKLFILVECSFKHFRVFVIYERVQYPVLGQNLLNKIEEAICQVLVPLVTWDIFQATVRNVCKNIHLPP